MITEHSEPINIPQAAPTNIELDTGHEMTIRVGQDSLKLRNLNEKLHMWVRGIWISVGDLVSKWLDP